MYNIYSLIIKTFENQMNKTNRNNYECKDNWDWKLSSGECPDE